MTNNAAQKVSEVSLEELMAVRTSLLAECQRHERTGVIFKIPGGAQPEAERAYRNSGREMRRSLELLDAEIERRKVYKFHPPTEFPFVMNVQELYRFKIGDHVRFIGTVSSDGYGGKSCGRSGLVSRIDGFVGVDFDNDGSIYACAPQFLELIVHGEGPYVHVPFQIWELEREIFLSIQEVINAFPQNRIGASGQEIRVISDLETAFWNYKKMIERES